MLFEKKYNYYLIKIDDDKTYWYRSNSAFYRIGEKVIVPISNNGKWKIGVVTKKVQVFANDVPYPLEMTKGIVQEASLFAEAKVKVHNNQIETSKFPPYDISITYIRTRQGEIRYVTCQRERDLIKQTLQKRNLVIIENYPASDLYEIPVEAQKRLKQEENIIDDFLCEMELMDELDS